MAAIVLALASGAGGLAGVVASTVGASPASADVALGTATTFTTTGAEQSVVVPSGATTMHVVAIGGSGGPATNTYSGAASAAGGGGAHVLADLPAPSSGSTIYVEVGANGPAGVSGAVGGSASGGFNGGGNATGDSGAGGGASDLRTVSASGAPATSLGSRLLVAGGGGGGGSASLNCAGGGCGSQAPGGTGGGGGTGATLLGGPGLGTPQPRGFDGGGGGGGTASVGGTGGAAGADPSGGRPFSGGPGVRGADGTSGSGGPGGGTTNGLSGAGGAGGGLFGGGGGGSGGLFVQSGGSSSGAGGGGGGGSSFVETGATGASATADTSGTPSVTITFTAASTTTVSCTPNPVPSGSAVTCTASVSPGGPTPTGTITWSGPTGGGTFSSNTCTLTAGSCSVTYTPGSGGSQTLRADYGGDSGHLPSSGTTGLTVATALRLAFTTPPVSGPVGGAVLGPITVQLQDGSGNPVAAPTGGAVLSLSSSSPTGVFSGSSGGSSTTAVTVPAGQSSATFFYGDTSPGTPTITVSSGNSSATQVEAVSPRLSFTTAPLTGPVSRDGMGPITVQLQDASGSPVPAPAGGTTLSLSSSSSQGAFTVAGQFVNQIVVPAGSNSASFLYGDGFVGTPTITVAAAGSSVTQTETVTPLLRFTTTSLSGPASTSATMGPITVQLQDLFTRAVPAPAGGTTITLSSSTGTGVFSLSSGGPTTTSIVIPEGSSSATFFFGDPTPGGLTLTAATTTSSAVQAEFVSEDFSLLVTTAPVSGAASTGASLGPITVQLTSDQTGQPVNAPAGGATVSLSSSSATGVFSASPNGPPVATVQIPAGASQASFYYGDPTPGNPVIHMTVPLAFPRDQQETIGPAVPTQLVFTTSPQSGPASTGANLGPITVQVTDSTGNAVVAPIGGTAVALGSTSGTGVFSASLNGPPTTSVQISAGATTASFFYGDPTPGSPSISASADGLTESQQETVSAIGRLAFTTSPASGPASLSANVGPLTVQLQDGTGKPLAASADTTVNLGAVSSGAGGGERSATVQPHLVAAAVQGPRGCLPPAPSAVFATIPGGPRISSVTIPAGQSSATFYLGEQLAGTDTVTVTAPALTPASQDETIVAGPPNQVAICGPGSLSGQASSSASLGPVTVSLVDSLGNVAAAPAGGAPVTLSSTSAGAAFAQSSGGARITSLVIPAGSSAASFFYGDTQAGSPIITVASPGLRSDNLGATINPGTPSSLVITSKPVSGPASASATLGPITVQFTDAFRNSTASHDDTTVALGSTSPGGIFSLTPGGPAVSSLVIPAGTASTQFFYGDSRVGSPTITASASALTAATQVATITSAVAPTSTTLSASPASPSFGQQVTLTATVTVLPPGQGTPPTGQVTFADGASALGTASLDLTGHARLSILPLAPGPHSIVASYNGDATHSPSRSAPDALVVGCSIVSGGHSGLVVRGPTCLQGATISGTVQVQPGAALSIAQSTVNGPVSSNGAAALRICSTTIIGALSAQSSNGLVIVGGGGDDAAAACGPDHIAGPVTLAGNKGVIELGGDEVGGPAKVTGNSASPIDPENRTTEIEANRISGPLTCSGNTPSPINDGLQNRVSGPESGQCTGL